MTDIKKTVITEQNLFYYEGNSNSYKITYYVNDKKTANAACFANLPSQLDKLKDTTTIVKYQPACHKDLTNEEIARWISLNIEYKTLPADIQHTQEGYAINATDKHYSLLYVYLCMLRFMEDDHKIVKGTILLVDKYKVDFYVAFTIASKLLTHNSGHHFFYMNASWGVKLNVNNTFVPIRWVIGLQRLVNHPHLIETVASAFEGEATIKSLCGIENFKISYKSRNSKYIKKAIYSTTDEEAKKYIAMFEKRQKAIEKNKAKKETIPNANAI